MKLTHSRFNHVAKDPGGNTWVLYNFATGRHVKLDALSLGLYAAAPSRPDTAFARIASFGFKPEMKISFDGLGFLDWMRGCEGAEQDALRAIKLCVDAGFPTRVQMNINRKNRDSILPSLALLDDMGVGRARVISHHAVDAVGDERPRSKHGVERIFPQQLA